MAELFSETIEQAVLGACLFDNDLWHDISGIVRPDDFYNAGHAKIFDLISARVSTGRSASPSLIVDDARKAGFDASYSDYVLACAANVPGTAGALDLARSVRDYAIRRALVSASLKARDDAFGETDVAETMAGLETTLQELQSVAMPSQASFLGEDAARFMDEALNPRPENLPVPTGIEAFDEKHGGLPRSGLCILAGRPSMGKTAIAISIAAGAFKAGLGVHFASLEMPKRDLWYRFASMLAYEANKSHIPYDQLVKGRPPEDPAHRELLTSLSQNLRSVPIIVDDGPGQTAAHIAASARASARKFAERGGKLGLVIVDYLTMMKSPRRSNDSRHEAVGEDALAMKNLAKALGCPVLLLAQLNRSVETRESKAPQLSDLRESGHIEEHADLVMGALRPEYYLQREEDPDPEALEEARGKLVIPVLKFRNGEVGSIVVDCDVSINTIRRRRELFPDYRQFRK
jgi:replicative DNA helicase